MPSTFGGGDVTAVAVGFALIILLLGILLIYAWMRRLQNQLAQMGAGFYAETRKELRTLRTDVMALKAGVKKLNSELMKANSRITENEVTKW